MSNLDKFMARGAECVAGSIILRNKVMANLRNGDSVLTEDGLAELEVEEVVVKEPVKAKPAAKKAAKAVEPEPAADDSLNFDDLLPDLE